MGLRQDSIGRLKQAIFPYELRIAVPRCLGEPRIILLCECDYKRNTEVDTQSPGQR